MENIIIELSKFIIMTLMLIYTFYCFYQVRRQDYEDQSESLKEQLIMIFLLDAAGFFVIFLKTQDFQKLIFGAEMVGLFALLQIAYRLLYKQAAMLMINNMCMLLSVGFIMLVRLDMGMAEKQLKIVAGASLIALVIPVIIRKIRILKKLTWFYAWAGILLLAAVLVGAKTSFGAKLSLFGVQPSELIKITFVFFMASMLYRNVTFKKVVMASAVAAVHVGILVLSTDLGSAAIFFVTYLVMIYVGTKQLRYTALGLVAGAGASVVAYRLFAHVQTRVIAWSNPLAYYDKEGYQISQSLFAIGNGGWFGTGLYKGMPKEIPVVENDFIFSAICEELGCIFGICLILVCMTMFFMILNISLRIKSPFYKMVALGLGTEYAFQVFLNIGGVTKFIPMTGVTLPLVSYGGTSALSTIILLAIIQGLYILREDEDEEIERLRREAWKRKQQEASQSAEEE